jgi:hypothetical protein
MHAYGQSFIRKPEFINIKPMYIGNGNYEPSTKTIRPRNKALWSDLYRIGAAGALSKVKPFGPQAFSGLGDTQDGGKWFWIAGISAAFLAFGALTVLGGRRQPRFDY